MNSGLVEGWTWEAFALAPSWLSRSKYVSDFFHRSTRITTAISTATRVAGTSPNINVTVKAGDMWPGTQWRTNFAVRYSGFVSVRIPGQYTFFVTASVGGNGVSCSVNGARVVASQFSLNRNSIAVFPYAGTTVRCFREFVPVSLPPLLQTFLSSWISPLLDVTRGTEPD
jgi:hypothetical protein